VLAAYRSEELERVRPSSGWEQREHGERGLGLGDGEVAGGVD